ncbi:MULTISPECIES: macrolide family glycosyltransferase [Nocardiopsis]|uniref:Glycosyl transferase n=1 Tax=Nocardiopsis sinuspersici TaxID=501010 RepID=A0A1V3BY27_9ACTN|nr:MULTISPECIES: macrolide family glycosyltransferase [Nocardiopsis]OOC53348.1 glycosyl transferase [Nocardiopsis sinuspersici]
MRPRHILCLSVQGHGHVHPSLDLIGELTARGHRVSYVTGAMFAEAVESAGAALFPYRSVFDDVHVPDLVGQDDAETRMHLLHLQENLAILRAAEAAFDDDPPDLVLYDVFPFIAGRLLARKWRRPAVRLSPIFAANEHYSIYEALWRGNGFRHPADVAGFEPVIRKVFAEFGDEHRSVREFWDEIEDLNIVFIPRSFQVAEETFDERFVFVGPSSPPTTEPVGWRPPEGGSPVLLVSLGNQFNEHPGFFRACAEAFAGSEWHVVLVVGQFLDPSELDGLPGRTEVHAWLPFDEVLPHTTVLLTQGTTGAVMDSLRHGRPLLVAPHFAPEARPSADQVVELGLGHRLDPDDTDPAGIARAVRALAADARTAKRAAAARADILAAGGAGRAADAVEEFARTSDPTARSGRRRGRTADTGQ